MPRNRSRRGAAAVSASCHIKLNNNFSALDDPPVRPSSFDSKSDTKSTVSFASQREAKAVGTSSGGSGGANSNSTGGKAGKMHKQPRKACSTCLSMRYETDMVDAHPGASNPHSTCRSCVQNWVLSQLSSGSGVTLEQAIGNEFGEPAAKVWYPQPIELEARVSIRCAQCPKPMSFASLYRACDVRAPLGFPTHTSRRALRALDRVMSGVSHMKDYLSCPKSDCTGGGFVKYDDRSSGVRHFKCNVCDRCFPSMMEQASTATASDKWKSTNSKPCPRCYAPTEKNGGCPHMTCTRCRHNWCWVCQQPFLDSHPQCSAINERVQNDPNGYWFMCQVLSFVLVTAIVLAFGYMWWTRVPATVVAAAAGAAINGTTSTINGTVLSNLTDTGNANGTATGFGTAAGIPLQEWIMSQLWDPAVSFIWWLAAPVGSFLTAYVLALVIVGSTVTLWTGVSDGFDTKLSWLALGILAPSLWWINNRTIWIETYRFCWWFHKWYCVGVFCGAVFFSVVVVPWEGIWRFIADKLPNFDRFDDWFEVPRNQNANQNVRVNRPSNSSGNKRRNRRR